MKKNENKIYMTIAIIFFVFSAISFLVPLEKTSTFYIGYVFGAVAILAQLYFYKISFAGSEEAKSKFYGFPIARIGVMYLIIQVIVSLVEMVLALYIVYWLSLIINIIIIAVAFVGSFAAEIIRDEIEIQDTVLKANVSMMRELQSLSHSLISMTSDTKIKKLLEALSEDFKYSDPVTNNQTEQFETELKYIIKEIQKSLIDEDYSSTRKLCLEAKASLAERNRICKLSK